MEACRRKKKQCRQESTAAGAALNGTRDPHQKSRVGFIHSDHDRSGPGRFLQVNAPTALVSVEDGADPEYPGSLPGPLDYTANGLVSEAFHSPHEVDCRCQ